MKSMQMFVYSYFIMNGIMKDNNSINKIQCYSASKKLDLLNFLPDDVKLIIKQIINPIKSKYTKNKKMAVLITKNIIRHNKWEVYFNSNSKKDDLADSLLMTLHYLNKQK